MATERPKHRSLDARQGVNPEGWGGGAGL